jgi:hypothetical protein
MGGEYTNRHRDWDETFDTIQSLRERNPPRTDPPADLERGKRIFTQGVPLKGDFECPVDEIPIRDKYDNHPAIKKNYAAVEEKFAKEEQKSFHIHFPRFLAYFIVGLLLNPLQWEFDKGKGRICVGQMDPIMRVQRILIFPNHPRKIQMNVPLCFMQQPLCGS